VTFRKFHIYNETYNRSLSKQNVPVYKTTGFRIPGSEDQKAPPILDFTSGKIWNLTGPFFRREILIRAGLVNLGLG